MLLEYSNCFHSEISHTCLDSGRNTKFPIQIEVSVALHGGPTLDLSGTK
jgi:hypothetical protein